MSRDNAIAALKIVTFNVVLVAFCVLTSMFFHG
jgi:hypothetical protein